MMKKTLVAVALVAAFGAAQAAVTGGTTDSTIVQVGTSNVTGGPHTSGKPGVGVDGTNIIDLAGISTTTFKVATTSGFDQYQLQGYTHQDPNNGGTITTHFNWARIPTITQEVYFGIATNPGTPNAHAAFYVGDNSSRAVPTATTNYTAVGYLATPSLSATSLRTLTGTLQYDYANNKVQSTGSHLTDGSYTLQISNATVSGATFSGTSTATGPSSFSGSGNANGEFFGSGSTSAIAGTAKGTSGSAYVASFGGIKN